MKKFLLFITLLFTSLSVVNAQNIGINTTGASPAPTALLDVSSTTQGELVPRMNTLQMNAIGLPATGLLIFNTDCNVFDYWNGAAWTPILSATDIPGAITGNTTVCTGSIQTYSISAVSGATSYTWTIPVGWIINSGQGTTSISTTVDSSQGNVCVMASTPCGTSNPSCTSVFVNPYGPGSQYAQGIQSQIFTYVGTVQTFTVPACVTSLTVKAWGAGGGGGGFDTYGSVTIDYNGGGGAYATSTVGVNPGDILQIYVGGAGQAGYTEITSNYAGPIGGW